MRPTGDRLKETLFDILGSEVQGAIVLDVFAGTGAIGLEALSRGAQEVIFVESNREATHLIKDNISLCGVVSGYRIVQGDIFTSLRTLARERFTADIIFLDPPYRWGPYGDLLGTLVQTAIPCASSRIVIEHHFKAALPESGPGYRRVRIVKQSDKCLSFYQTEE